MNSLVRFNSRWPLFLGSLALCSCLSSEKETSSTCVGESCVGQFSPKSATLEVHSCNGLSTSDLAKVISLENEILVPQSSTLAKIEELGRMGCDRSATALLTVALEIDSNAQISNDGVIDFQMSDDSSKLLAVFKSLAAIQPEDPTAIEFISKYASETRLTRDGGSGHEVKDAALAALLNINQGVPVLTSIKGAAPDLQGNCSQSYLQVDGTRSSYISNWSTYENSISSALPSDPILQQLAVEPFYCDGHNGFHMQNLSIARISFAEELDDLQFAKDVLYTFNFRGSPIAGSSVARMWNLLAEPSEEALAELLELIDENQNLHADEYTRAKVTQVIGSACRSAGKSPVEYCQTTVKPILRQRLEKDPYNDVRYEASFALENMLDVPPPEVPEEEDSEE